jgi:hypothetical protein
MKTKLFALLTYTVLALPAGATPNRFAIDGGLMTNVPNIGYSRVETVNFCAEQAGVEKYQDLMTDSEFETFEGCMTENT